MSAQEMSIEVNVTNSRFGKYKWNLKYEKINDTFYGSAICDKGLSNKSWSDLKCNDEETAINVLREHCKDNSR